jgi:transmembrane sensor
MVTLLKGHVVVLPSDGRTATAGASATPPGWTAEGDAACRIDLSPGQQLVISSGRAPEVTQIDVERVTAWEQGEIVFDNEPLAEVIRRVNRYGQRRIAVGDDRAADLRISGVFHQGDIDGFVSTIATYLPVRAHERPDGAVVLTYRSSVDDHLAVP